jgi:sugar lactone lactonase YvrE
MNLRERLASLAPGAITTVAGAGYSVGIPAREADAGWPMGVARRPDGDLIVIDYHAHRIWRIDRGGSLHMFAGDGVAGFSPDGTLAIEARLDTPYGLCLYGDDILLMSDHFNNKVRAVRL